MLVINLITIKKDPLVDDIPDKHWLLPRLHIVIIPNKYYISYYLSHYLCYLF